MEINEALKEALTNGMAVVIYQTEKGPSYGFIETEAIVEAVERVDEDDDPYYAAAIATAEGGDISKTNDFSTLVLNALKGTWETAREMLIGDDEPTTHKHPTI